LEAKRYRIGGSHVNHKLDTDAQVFFYEQDFYILSNFSSFMVHWRNHHFPTAEHVYHFERFVGCGHEHRAAIKRATSAHEAFRYAQSNRQHQRPDWEAVRVDIMREILRAKARQHEYVHRKLLATGDRQLVEDSWRDSFWGWGPNHDGKNMLGVLWMEVRAELRAADPGGFLVYPRNSATFKCAELPTTGAGVMQAKDFEIFPLQPGEFALTLAELEKKYPRMIGPDAA
jgi:ribA/ribD-fused uncharacterized protein